jgi:hypothetical protein
MKMVENKKKLEIGWKIPREQKNNNAAEKKIKQEKTK